MCFVPQPRALFAGLNFQKCSKAVVLFTIWLRNVLRATAACAFCRAQLPKVLQSWGAFYNLTSKRASRHSGVQFLISHTTRWLRRPLYWAYTLQPSGAVKHWKNTVFRDFLPFRALWASLFVLALLWSSFFIFLLVFSSLTSYLLPFSSLTISDSSHLCCFICPYGPKFDFQTSFD